MGIKGLWDGIKGEKEEAKQSTQAVYVQLPFVLTNPTFKGMFNLFWCRWGGGGGKKK